jgi:hypothetical protein
MEGVWHPFEDLFQSDHLAQEAFNVAGHNMLLASGNGVGSVLKRCCTQSVKARNVFRWQPT